MTGRELEGRRVVNTRAAEQAGELSRALRERGAAVAEMPMISFGPPDDWGDFDRAVAAIERFDWIVFTSANGVRFALERLAGRGQPPDRLRAARIAAVGPKTAAALRHHGLEPDRIPDDFLAAGLLRTFPAAEGRGLRFFLPRGHLADPEFPAELRRRGARVEEAVVYRTRPPAPERRSEWEKILVAGIDVVAFTSASTVDHFVALFGPGRTPRMIAAAAVACIGPVTSAAAARHGLRCAIEPAVHTVAGLVDAIVDHFRRR